MIYAIIYIYTYNIHTIVITFGGSSEIAPNMNKHWVHVYVKTMTGKWIKCRQTHSKAKRTFGGGKTSTIPGINI